MVGLFAKREPEDAAKSAIVWRGAEALRTMLVPLTDLRPDERNARRHPERNIEAVRTSLREFGQRKPIVSRGGVVIAGNGTHTAAGLEGWTHLAAVDTSDLTREQALAYAIADNKSSDLAEWDFQELSGLLRELPAELLDATGFADFEREPLLQAEWVKPEATDEDGSGHAGAHPHTVGFSTEQWKIAQGAIAKVRDGQDGPDTASDGRCLELICADFLSGA